MENLHLRLFVIKLFFLTSVSLILSCSSEPPEIIEEINLKVSAIDSIIPSKTNSRIVKDQYIVILSKKSAKNDLKSQASLEALIKEVGNMPNARMKGVYRSALTGFVAKLSPKQVEKLKNDSRVISVTADRYVHLEDVAETAVSVQEYPIYGLDRIDQRDKQLDRAYSFTSTGSGVTAYIIDTGIKSSHNEFNGRVSLGFDFVLAYPDENDVINSSEPGEDCHSHGTHVAGTVGGSTYGVAKEVNLVNLRVFGCTDGSPYSRIIHAVDWVTENAIKPAVVNMSLGDPVADLEVLADVAVQNSIASGVTYVIAGGNSSLDACDFSPARVPEAITVGASTIENKMAWWSNYGNCLDLYAPGVYILSAGITDDNSTRIMSGTSMAAPHVTGIAALYLSKNPAATPAEIHQAVVENSTPAAISGVPSGTTSLAYSHWESVAFTAPVPPDLSFTATSSKDRRNYRVDMSWDTPAGSRVVISRDGNVIFEPGVNESSFVDFLGNVRDATYVYQVCEVLYKNCSERVIIIGKGDDTSQPLNSPPNADFSFSTNLLDVQFTDLSTDSDGSLVGWNWDFGDGTSSPLQHPQHAYSQAGTYDVSLVVTDDSGDSQSVTKIVSVSEEVSNPAELQLSAVGYKVKGQWHTDLSWNPANTSEKIDIYRDGKLWTTIPNTGSFTDKTSFKGSGTLTYKVCEFGTTVCSNLETAQF